MPKGRGVRGNIMMIVLVSKYNEVTGKPVTVRRDLTGNEIQEMIIADHPGVLISRGTFSCFPGIKDSARVGIYHPSRCKASDPITMQVSNGHETLAFRGTVIVCGERDGEDCSIYEDVLSIGEEGRIEPIYKDDAICIPSVDEWLAVPEKIRETLVGGLWCWSRDIDREGCSTVISYEGIRGSYFMNEDSGGVVAFVRLSRLPDDVAKAIHDHTDDDGVVCFEPYRGKISNGMPDCANPAPYLVKLTNEVYGIAAYHRNPVGFYEMGELCCIDPDKHNTYANSWLRDTLNDAYLDAMVKYIRKSIKEGN